MTYIPPMLDEPKYSVPRDPKREVPWLTHLGQILIIGVSVGLVAFLAALLTAIVTAGS
jgi:hypothetical protein